MTQESRNLPLVGAAHVIDAINDALDSNKGARASVEYLLQQLRQMLAREEATCSLFLFEGLDRQPGPSVIERFRLLSPLWETAPQMLEDIQRLSDDLAPLHQVLLPRVLEQLRTPTIIVCSEDLNKTWFQDVLYRQYLEPAECLDIVVGAWAASPNRKLDLSVLRHRSQPSFSLEDRNLISLMLRALGPLVDRELFRVADFLNKYDLTERQSDVLKLLLCGDSEKEIANLLHRSVHTVHSHVKDIYRVFEVQTRGELMAMFVDRRLIELRDRV